MTGKSTMAFFLKIPLLKHTNRGAYSNTSTQVGDQSKDLSGYFADGLDQKFSPSVAQQAKSMPPKF